MAAKNPPVQIPLKAPKVVRRGGSLSIQFPDDCMALQFRSLSEEQIQTVLTTLDGIWEQALVAVKREVVARTRAVQQGRKPMFTALHSTEAVELAPAAKPSRKAATSIWNLGRTPKVLKGAAS